MTGAHARSNSFDICYQFPQFKFIDIYKLNELLCLINFLFTMTRETIRYNILYKYI